MSIKMKLKEIANVEMGQSPDSNYVFEYDDLGMPFLQGNADFGDISPSPQFYCSKPLKRAQKGDILISVRAPVGAVNLADQTYCIGRGLAAIRPKNSHISSKLFQNIISANKQSLIRVAQGSTFEAISKNDLLEMDIYVPESDLLQKIDNTLDVIEQTISQTRIIIEKLIKKKQGLLNDLLTRGVDSHGNLRPSYDDAPNLFQETELGFIPKEWDISLLDDIATRGSGHTPNKNVPSYWNGGIKWVSLADSSKLDQIHISETDKEISHLGIQNSSAVMHCKGTVILSRDASIGRSAILTDDMAVSQHFMAWKCSKRLNNYFLYYWLQKDKPVFENIAIGSTIKTIGLPFFKTYKIAVPSINEQEKISAIILNVDNYLSDEINKLNKLEKVKIGLLKDLLQN